MSNEGTPVGGMTLPFEFSFQEFDRVTIDSNDPTGEWIESSLSAPGLANHFTKIEVGPLSPDATLEDLFEVLAAKGTITDLQWMTACDNTADPGIRGQELGKYVKGFTYKGGKIK
jgi:hypothetical protein